METIILSFIEVRLNKRGSNMKLLNRIFHLDERKASTKTEIIGGIVTFVAMIYILPLNAKILGDMGMNTAGVFAITGLVSFVVTMMMGLLANYPIALSTSMGLNSFVAYNLSSALGFDTWQQKLIVLTIAGVIFFVFSLTPLRRKLMESIPKDIRCIISACLGAFIACVGLKGGGIIIASAETLVTFGSFADPAMAIAFFSVILCFGLMFIKNKIVSNFAIPIAIIFAAISGVIISTSMFYAGKISMVDGTYIYTTGVNAVDNCAMNLPIAPWIEHPAWGINGVQDVIFYGTLSADYGVQEFGNDLAKVFSLPATYVAVFSLMFVKMFDSTATLVSVGEKTGMIDENGKMQNYRRAVAADATGTLICGPLGTSAVSPFAESNVGVSLGAKTGLAACVTASLFLLSTFIFPVFSIFTSGSVTAAALVCVGAMIVVNAMKGMNLKDPIVTYTAIIGILFALLTYSISNGIGIAVIIYNVSMLIAGRRNELNVSLYAIGGLFVISFIANTIITMMI